MLGPAKVRDLDRSVLISLESAVPRDHFYRHLERTLDLTFVRDLVADRYADAGRPSIDPVVFFKLELIMFFEGIRSGPSHNCLPGFVQSSVARYLSVAGGNDTAVSLASLPRRHRATPQGAAFLCQT